MKTLQKRTVCLPLMIGVLLGLAACTERASIRPSATSAPNPTAAPTETTSSTAMNSAEKGKIAGSEEIATANLSDAEIADVIQVTNEAEIGAGALAKTRAGNPAVRAYAKHLVDEHKKNTNEKDFFKAWNGTTSETNISKNIRAESTAELVELRKISGSDFDQVYIQNQLAMHKQYLNDLDNRYIPAAQDAQLKNFLKQTRKQVSNHLSDAQNVVTMMNQ